MQRLTRLTIAVLIIFLLAGFGPWLTGKLSRKKGCYATAEAAQRISYNTKKIGTTCFVVSIDVDAHRMQSLIAAAEEINAKGYAIENAANIEQYGGGTNGMFFFVKPKIEDN